MELYVCIDPMYKDTYWCNQYIKGIRFEASQNNRLITMLEDEDLHTAFGVTSVHYEDGIVMLLGATRQWIRHMAGHLVNIGMHVVVISASGDIDISGVSTVCADYRELIRSLCSYMSEYGRVRTALFGYLPDSASDIVKRHAFESFMIAHDRKQYAVIENRQNLGAACQQMMEQYEQFDSVICCNDIAAIKLLTCFKEHSVPIPEKMWMATIGNTILARMTQPGITSAIMDCIAIGRQAVKVCMMLAKTPLLTSVRTTVSCSIDVRETTQSAPCKRRAKQEQDIFIQGSGLDFYSDESVRDIFRLEALLDHVSSCDVKILQGIRSGVHYDSLAEQLYLSESAIKYKLRRMCQMIGEDKRGLLALIERYLSFDQLCGMYAEDQGGQGPQ